LVSSSQTIITHLNVVVKIFLRIDLNILDRYTRTHETLAMWLMAANRHQEALEDCIRIVQTVLAR
jgi:hypothetical protein